MKILAIMGSPRKGESYKITQMVEERMKKLGDVEFEYLFLKDANLKSCVGCEICITKGEESCPLQDDLLLLRDKMQEADGILLVSPVYCQHVTALMKNFLDHMTFMWHRPRLFGKKFMAISSGGGMFKDTLGYLKQNAEAWGGDFVHQLGVPHLDSLRQKYYEKAIRNIDRAAASFFKAVKEKKTVQPGIGRFIWFGMWKSNAIACKEYLKADYEYWKSKGWLERDYYYAVRPNPVRKTILTILGAMGKMFMGNIYKGYE